jgi:hypothetical protein
VPAAGGSRGRSLTIGEAVARLAAEFPGIRPETLRLLEQQGVVSPERTSSGFRRYSERDLEAVRRALSGPPRPRSAAGPGPSGPGGSVHATLWRSPSAAHPAEPAPEERGSGPAEAAEPAAAAGRAVPGPAGGRTAERVAARPAAAPASPAARTRTVQDAAAAAPVAPAAPTAAVSPEAAAEPEEPLSGPSQGAARRRTARWPEPDFFTPVLGEVSLGREGLARAAGIAPEWVDELREHGLIGVRDPASGSDLLVARAAAELIGHGIEPRHLLPVRIAAGRAAALVEAAAVGSSARSGTAQVAAALVRLEAALLRAALLDD